MLQLLRNDEIWKQVLSKAYKSYSFSVSDKLCLSILSNPKNYNALIDTIENGTFEWSIPYKVEIPKSNGRKRIIYIHSLRDRLLLSVMNKAFTRHYADSVSKYVYSYKEDIRSLSAVQSLIQDKQLFDKYAMKLDISSYFNSVNQSSLIHIIDEISCDNPALNKLLKDLLLTNKVSHKNQIKEEYMSLIPGCAFSSFLANYTLKHLDDEIGNMQDVTYARYSDDMIFFVKDKSQFTSILDIVSKHLNQLGLSINSDKYEYFDIGEPFEFLGLKVYKDMKTNKPIIDIKASTVNKLKKKIKAEVKRRRAKIERENKNPDVQLAKFFYYINSTVYKTYIYDPSKFGWAYYVFNNVNTIETLRQLDFYLKERARYLYTGKNNKNSLNKISDEKLKSLGMKSFVQMYQYFKIDKDLYRNELREIERVYVTSTQPNNQWR